MADTNTTIPNEILCESGLALSPKAIDFSEKSIRQGFIRKVYAILMSQLLLTMGLIAFFLFHQPSRLFLLKYAYVVLFILLFVTIFTVIALSCFGNFRRTPPWNYVVLFAYTITVGVSIGMVASLFAIYEVMIAAGVTAGVCLGISLYAVQTKWDYTPAGGWLLTTILVLGLYGATAFFFPQTRTLRLVYCAIGVLVYSLYLVYDTQVIMGGEHKYSISPEEYVFAALHLYLDIVNIFIFILRIMHR